MGDRELPPIVRLLKLATLDKGAATVAVADKLVGCPVACAVTKMISPIDMGAWIVTVHAPLEVTVVYGVPLLTVSDMVALACAVPLTLVAPAKSGVFTVGIAVPLTVT